MVVEECPCTVCMFPVSALNPRLWSLSAAYMYAQPLLRNCSLYAVLLSPVMMMYGLSFGPLVTISK